MSDLSGRVVVITGGGNGLGRSYAHLLATLGASIVVNDLGTTVDGERRSSSAAESVAEDIRRGGGRAVADSEDVADPSAAGRLMARAVQEHARGRASARQQHRHA